MRKSWQKGHRRIFAGFLARALFLVFITGAFFSLRVKSTATQAGPYEIKFPEGITRQWVSPDFYAQRLEDWRVNQGAVECLSRSAGRYLYLLTGEIEQKSGLLEISVRVAVPQLPERPRARNYVGFRVGVKSPSGDFRQAALNPQGVEVGLTTEGLLFIGELESVSTEEKLERLRRALRKGVDLKLSAGTAGHQAYLRISVVEPESGEVLDDLEEDNLTAEELSGGLALISSLPEVQAAPGSAVSSWSGLGISGNLLQRHPERAFGPVAFTMYTLSHGTLNLSAQLVPGCLQGEAQVVLEILSDNRWKEVARSPVSSDSWLAVFRVHDWDSSVDREFRVRVEAPGLENLNAQIPTGIIRKEPTAGDRLLMAVLSQNREEGYPHSGLLSVLKKQNPDLLFFAGNQVFGRPASFWQKEFTLEEARQEYLRQWLLFGWAFSDLLRDRPAIVLPDARDYFQIKLWGEGGRQAEHRTFTDPALLQDSGGFLMPQEFIRLVLETQLSHLPEPEKWSSTDYSGEPFWREVRYGGLSLAVVCDRVFKSAPEHFLPEAKVAGGWLWNEEFDLKKKGVIKEARLLGPGQIDFLKKWAEDWSGGVWIKVFLSQSLWVSLLSLPGGLPGEQQVFRLVPLQPGEYPPDDRPVADFNSGGWPKPARDEVVSILRKAFALHISGGGGPPAAVKYGLEAADDAVWAFAPPPLLAPAAVRWMPETKGRGALKKNPLTDRSFEDTFGNRFKLKAITNPLVDEVRAPGAGVSGCGLIIFDKKERRIILDCLLRPEDTPAAEFRSCSGWPVSFSQLENDGRRPAGYLPVIQFKGIVDPVVQVVEEKSGEVVYTLRIKGKEFRPPVFHAGSYTVRCGEPGTSAWKEIKGISSLPSSQKKVMVVEMDNSFKTASEQR